LPPCWFIQLPRMPKFLQSCMKDRSDKQEVSPGDQRRKWPWKLNPPNPS
jgi:hypothetical protein